MFKNTDAINEIISSIKSQMGSPSSEEILFLGDLKQILSSDQNIYGPKQLLKLLQKTRNHNKYKAQNERLIKFVNIAFAEYNRRNDFVIPDAKTGKSIIAESDTEEISEEEVTESEQEEESEEEESEEEESEESHEETQESDESESDSVTKKTSFAAKSRPSLQLSESDSEENEDTPKTATLKKVADTRADDSDTDEDEDEDEDEESEEDS